MNISREILQNNAVINKISNALTKRVLKEIAELKNKKLDDFLNFWKNFGPVIKEGLYEFNDFHDQIFDFTMFDCSEQNEMITLDEYLSKYPNDKKKIYYISGENKQNLLNSPQMELFKNKKINVLLVTDPVDEFWMPMKMKFKDFEFTSITKGEVDIEDTSKESKVTQDSKDVSDFINYLKEHLKEKVKDAFPFLLETNKYYLKLPFEIDKGEEKRRLQKELDYQTSFLKSVEKKLSNDNFIKNAPEKILMLEKKKQEDAKTKINSLTQQISSF